MCVRVRRAVKQTLNVQEKTLLTHLQLSLQISPIFSSVPPFEEQMDVENGRRVIF